MTASGHADDAPGRRSTVTRGSGPLTIKERRRLNPSCLTKAMVAVAVRALPPAHRNRYALEFYAELYELPRRSQPVYACSLVLHSTSLAMALDDPRVVPEHGSRLRWLCGLRVHSYVRRNNPDAETREAAFYRQCTRCGRIDDEYRGGPPELWMAGPL